MQSFHSLIPGATSGSRCLCHIPELPASLLNCVFSRSLAPQQPQRSLSSIQEVTSLLRSELSKAFLSPIKGPKLQNVNITYRACRPLFSIYLCNSHHSPLTLFQLHYTPHCFGNSQGWSHCGAFAPTVPFPWLSLTSDTLMPRFLMSSNLSSKCCLLR